MAFENPVMVELMVPRDPNVAARIHGFYEEIGWEVRNASDSEFFTYTSPHTSEVSRPTLAYWQTENIGKTALFSNIEIDEPSPYARGLRLPQLQELVEVCLVVPSDNDVHNIFERGGALLRSHTHILPRDHAGKQEFRFEDPFNYSLRVTGDPGWEIDAPSVYRSKFVTALVDRVTGRPAHAITRENLRQYATTQYGSASQGERLWNILMYHIMVHDNFPLQRFFVQGREQMGLKPSAIEQFIAYIKQGPGRYDIRNFGGGSESLLQGLYDELATKE